MEGEVRKIIQNVRTDLVTCLNSLDEHSKKIKKQQTCTKLKIVLGLICQNNKQQLTQQLAQYNDPDITEAIKTLFEKNDNVSIKPSSKVESKPQHAQNNERKSIINRNIQKPLQKNNRSFSQSLLEGLLGNMKIKKQKEVKEMILPKNQPKYYYDPTKNKYVIEGQEEEEQVVVKPPPKRTANKTENTAKAPQKKSEIQEMMAPPAFKRKGVNKKEQIKKPKQAEINFEVFQQKITNNLQQCINKLLELFEDQFEEKIKNYQPRQSFSSEELVMLKSFSQQIRSAQQISDTMLTRLYSSYIDSQFENQAIGSMVKKLIQLEQTNNQVFSLFWNQKQNIGRIYLQGNKKQQKVNEGLDNLGQQMKMLKLQNQRLQSQLQMATKGLADEREKYKLNLQSQVSQNSMIKSLIDEKRQQIEQLNREKMLKQNENSQLRQQLNSKRQETKTFKGQIAYLKQKLANFEITLHSEQQNLLSSIIKKSSQLSLMEQLNQAIIAQNELFLAIQAKRISISTQGKQTGNQVIQEEERPNSGCLLQLSDSLSKVVQHYQAQISSLKKQVTFLTENYQVAKAQGNKIQQSLGAQNQTLQRSLNRMKSLMQDYKQTKQQLQIKVAQVQNENMSLQRQITHIRKEHNYTKQVLQQNIRSSHDNTATMKQQLQEQIKHLQERLEQKQMNERLHNQQIRQSGEQIKQLIGQNKGKSIKIGNLQKDMNGLRLELDEKILEFTSLQQKLKQQQKQLQSLRKKLSQQKTKNETNNKSQKIRIKQLQDQISGCKQEMKQQHRIYSEQLQADQQVRKQNQQLLILVQQTNKQNQQTKNINIKLQETLHNKQKQLQQIQKQVQQYCSQILRYQQGRKSLQQQAQNNLSTIKSINLQVLQYKKLYDQQCNQTQQLLQQLAECKKHMGQAQEQTDRKIEYLINTMGQNQEQTQQLTISLSKYQQLVKSMNRKIEQLENQNRGTQQSLLETISELEIKNKELEIKNKEQIRQKQQYRQVIETSSIKSNKQKQSLYNQLHKLSTKLTQLSTIQQEYHPILTLNKQQQNKIKQLEQQVKVTVQQKDQYEQINIQMQKQIQSLQKEVINLTNDLNMTNNSIQLQRRQSSQRKQQLQKQYQIIHQLQQQIQDKSNLILTLQTKSKELQYKQKENNEKYKEYQNKISQLLIKLDDKQTQLAQSIHKISDLSQQINRNNTNKEVEHKARSKNQAEQNSINVPGNNINVKDKLIYNIQSAKEQIIKKQQSIQKLTSQLKNSNSQIEQYRENLDNSNKLLSQMESRLADEQKTIRKLQLQNKRLLQQIKQYKKMNQQLQQISIKKLSSEEIGENNISLEDSQEMQQLIIVLEQNITEKQKQIEGLELKISNIQAQLQGYKEINLHISKEKSELEDLYNRKSEQAQKTIEKLQHQIRQLKKYQSLLQNMDRKYKDLQLQNSELIKQKIQILKTRDQILNKLHSLQKSQSKQPDNKASQHKQNTSSLPKPSKKQEYHSSIATFNQNPPKKGLQTQNGQQKSNGFFGSLSSLFLTQTELEKINKTRK